MSNSTIQLQQLQKQLWNIANTLRGSMGADEFRDYILGLIFYKYLSEKSIYYSDELLKNEGIELAYGDLDEDNPEHARFIELIKEASINEVGFALTPKQLFHSIATRCRADEVIIDDLREVLQSIEQSTIGSVASDDFANLFDDLDLTSTKLGKGLNERNALISKVIIHLDDIDFDFSNTETDVLGDAYEYLIGEFASGAGKKAGEFYTPQMVSTILAKLVTQDKTHLDSVYDPTCGSGSLLLRVKREVGKVHFIYGQEKNRTTYNLARMNMILHDVHFSTFDIKQDDTLENPLHLDKKFEAVVANPPFSANWSAKKAFLQDPRFQDIGKLAPKSKADLAFVQHMYYQLADNGTMAVVLPHGALFRGAGEGEIRKFFIENKNAIDAIIGLPSNIFYGTSIPTCIMVLKKQRGDNDGNILFIDASNEFDKQKTQNILLPEHIEKIVSTYQKRENVDKYAYVASLQEVKENDFNLNIPRYVDTFEPEADIDIEAVASNLHTLAVESEQTDQKLGGFCHELGILSPFSKE